MRKLWIPALCVVALLAVAARLSLAGEAGEQVTVTGWLTDSFCGAGNAKAEGKACALKCLEKGAKLVLYSPADQKTFSIDRQEEAKSHVGHEVKVTGTLDKANQTIKVQSIAPAKEEKKG